MFTDRSSAPSRAPSVNRFARRGRIGATLHRRSLAVALLALATAIAALPTSISSRPVASSTPLAVVQPCRLDDGVVHPGDRLHASAIVQNPGSEPVSLATVVLAGRPPGGTNAGGPYADFNPQGTRVTVGAGQTFRLDSWRSFAPSDPTGTWRCYLAYQTASGMWFDSPSATFSLAGGSASGSGSTGGSGGHFTTLSPGSALPDDATCAAAVQRSSWEPRPENASANHRVPSAAEIDAVHQQTWTTLGQSPQADARLRRVTGNFTGTTDEILQWAACKWGIDENVVRAEAVVESYWRMSTGGDYAGGTTNCAPGTFDGSGCFHSWGILQIRYDYMHYTWPLSRESTAFNADHTYAWIRNCYEGGSAYLYHETGSYRAGDLWGCLGFYFSGRWYDSRAQWYIPAVQKQLQDAPWRNW